MKKFEFESCLRYAKLLDDAVKNKTGEQVHSCIHNTGDMTIDSRSVLQGNRKKIKKIIRSIPKIWKYTPLRKIGSAGVLFFTYQGGLLEDGL